MSEFLLLMILEAGLQSAPGGVPLVVTWDSSAYKYYQFVFEGEKQRIAFRRDDGKRFGPIWY